MKLTKDEVKDTADLLKYSCHDHASINKLVEYIQALQDKVDQMGWISVDEKIPTLKEAHHMMFVNSKSKGVIMAFYATADKNWWRTLLPDERVEIIDDVTDWKSKPTAPPDR